MSQTPGQRWNPFVELDITTHRSKEIQCTGLNRYNARCGWTVEKDAREQILRLLDDMSVKLPRDTLNLLPQLAKASLCRKYHQGQADGKVEEWTAIINEIVPHSGANRPRADSAQPSQPFYNTRATDSSSRNLTELADLQFKYDKVVKDVNALHDQNKALEEKLMAECQRVQDLEARVAKLEAAIVPVANIFVVERPEDRKSTRRATQVQEESASRPKRKPLTGGNF